MDEAVDGWEVTSSELAYDGRFKVVRDQLTRPDGGTMEYTWIPSNHAAAVLAFDAQGSVVLTRQYRHPLRRTILDLPAGGRNEGESFAEAAVRELREETGYIPGKLERLGAFYPSPGRQETVVELFVATGLQPGVATPDENEVIEVIHMPWPEVLDLVIGPGPVDSALAYAVLLWAAKLKLSQMESHEAD